MMFKSTHVKALVDICSNKCILKGNTTQKSFRSFLIRNLYDTSTSSETISFENQLKGVFKFKNSNICNWIVENKARILCSTYQESSKNDKEQILRILAFKYAVQHPVIFNIAEKFVSTEPNNERRIVSYERNLKNALTPDYQWLFITIGRLQNGVKFLVDLRTDILELILKAKDTEESIAIQQLNITLRDLLLLWFSVGFLHLERVTWQTSCDILQKISDYEAIHPIRNWLDLKQRVGPYRRCYIFTHPSMPREPLVVLHTALCDIIPDSLRGIEEAKVRILDNPKTEVTFLEEDKCKIKTAIFYSITSTQKGLQGIELGNYLIKEVAKQVLSEFPMITELSTLSPIPNFRTWFLEKTKQDIHNVFTNEEYESIQKVLNNENIVLGLKKIFNNSLWTRDIAICEILQKPLLRACAWYLYKEKRRNYALNNVANFHLRNGAVMWRINWLADPSPRGVENSCGIMVNYRYYLDECEKNSQNYIENYFINTSEDVINLANQFEKL
ncbi:malonyl-CoA decarboxylase, mitochondrial [Bombus impatiens]|uniref:Malonyl-CoA decarboxylase, mitochondrial n=1 Tax=Bombus impatiens TaxID=132113 RepID=A0A6P3UPN4_BOMIM|nr:malonyl-CoA decarboxylase, mitochondrial [Bombus impatiens]XP_033175556.1 malonyl-CoA decarboxylase, mitochondrial [Bombus impatiens]